MADPQKTEQPTERRLQKARREGRFPVSREFVSAVQFALFVALLVSQAGAGMLAMRRSMRFLLARAFEPDLTVADVAGLLRSFLESQMLPLLAAGSLLVGIAMFSNLLVTRMGFAGNRLAPDFARLDPLARLRQLPGQNFPLFLQALILLPVFSFAVYAIVEERLEAFLRLPWAGLESGIALVASTYGELFWRAAGIFLVFGFIDLFRQQRRYRNELRMSKQEVRDESKEQEGNPQVKMRIRRIQRDLARRNMMKAIPAATAVVVNPTHFAVAIRYRMEVQQAPLVVAKGKNYLALRIRDKALEHQIPIVENRPLAQALYKSVDVGQEIPVHLYRAVAEILAYIYKLMHGKLPGA